MGLLPDAQHVHMIAIPSNRDGLRLAIGEAHRRYTRRVNFRQGWRGHLWQGRFASCVMQQSHLLACIRYIEMGDGAFIEVLEGITGLRLKAGKSGPKPKPMN